MGNSNSGRRANLKRHFQITELHATGVSQVEIARRLGVSRQYVNQIVTRWNALQRDLHCADCGALVGRTAKERQDTVLCQRCLARRPDTPFGLLLKSLRLAQGLSQAELAAKVKLTQSHIGQLERGVVRPSWDMACSLLRVLGGDVRVLLPKHCR